MPIQNFINSSITVKPSNLLKFNPIIMKNNNMSIEAKQFMGLSI